MLASFYKMQKEAGKLVLKRGMSFKKNINIMNYYPTTNMLFRMQNRGKIYSLTFLTKII